MAYCTYQEVVSEFKSLDVEKPGAVVTSDLINSWIAQADAYINARLNTLYVTPITDADDLLLIKQVTIGIVAQRIAYKMEVKGISANGDQYIPKDKIRESKEILEMLIKREMILSGTNRATSHAGVSSYTEENSTERVFDTECDQW